MRRTDILQADYISNMAYLSSLNFLDTISLLFENN